MDLIDKDGSTESRIVEEWGKSFMGTDATYDDLSSRNVDRDNHELKGEETVGSYDCYVVKSWAKDPTDSPYAYRISWIDKITWVPVKVQMFDKKEALPKELTVEKLENVNGYCIPMANLLKNPQSGHSSRLVISKIEVDKPIDKRLFTTNFLAQGR